MTRDQVRAVLGKPVKANEAPGSYSFWFYERDSNVEFDDEGVVHVSPPH
jgi:outer membrane protein assembly factor BamE (lipoprotein component of BamABCDE complex)